MRDHSDGHCSQQTDSQPEHNGSSTLFTLQRLTTNREHGTAAANRQDAARRPDRQDAARRPD